MTTEWKPMDNSEGWIKNLTYEEYLQYLEEFQQEGKPYLEDTPEGTISVELRSYAGSFSSVFSLVATK